MATGAPKGSTKICPSSSGPRSRQTAHPYNNPQCMYSQIKVKSYFRRQQDISHPLRWAPAVRGSSVAGHHRLAISLKLLQQRLVNGMLKPGFQLGAAMSEVEHIDGPLPFCVNQRNLDIALVIRENGADLVEEPGTVLRN